MKPATKVVPDARTLLGRATCSIRPVVHHRDPVRHRQRLLLVVGDVDEGDPDVALDPLQLHLQALAELQVQRSERLVQQQDLRQVDERPGQRDPLLLAAGELVRPAVRLRREARHARAPPPRARSISRLGDLLAPKAEGDVLADAQVGEQGVALKDGVRGPLVRRAGRPRPRRRSAPARRLAPRSRRPSAGSWSCRSRWARAG